MCARGNVLRMRSHASESVDDFRIDEERAGDGAVVLVLHGEADLHSAPLLSNRLDGTIDSDAPGVVVITDTQTEVIPPTFLVTIVSMSDTCVSAESLASVSSRP